jgi:hypothetical protein
MQQSDEYIEEDLYLDDFSFSGKVPHPTILLVGKRMAGKSFMSVAIADSFKVARWAAWCGTKDTEDFWAERFGSRASVYGPDERGKAALDRIIKFQQQKIRQYKNIYKKPLPAEYEIGLIFDDVTAARAFRRGEILEDLFSNGRHYHAVIIISCQYIKQLPPAVRTNTDYLFMLHNTKRTIKILYEEYVENPEHFETFMKMLRFVTGQKDQKGKDIHNALVYDNVVKTYDLGGMFKVFRHRPEFALDQVNLGSPAWREYNTKHFKDTEFEADKQTIRRKTRIQRLELFKQQQQQQQQQKDPSVQTGHHDATGKSSDHAIRLAPEYLDVDYVSDSEEDEDGPRGTGSKNSKVSTIQLKAGRHHHLRIFMKKEERAAALTTNLPTSGVSGGIPNDMTKSLSTDGTSSLPYAVTPVPSVRESQQQTGGDHRLPGTPLGVPYHASQQMSIPTPSYYPPHPNYHASMDRTTPSSALPHPVSNQGSNTTSAPRTTGTSISSRPSELPSLYVNGMNHSYSTPQGMPSTFTDSRLLETQQNSAFDVSRSIPGSHSGARPTQAPHQQAFYHRTSHHPLQAHRTEPPRRTSPRTSNRSHTHPMPTAFTRPLYSY